MNPVAASRAPVFGLPGRIQAANATPRSLALVGLGAGGAAVARRLAEAGVPHLAVHVLATSAARNDALSGIRAEGGTLQRDLERADMIFVVACGGDDATLASVVFGIARGRRQPVTALYIVPPEALKQPVHDDTLGALRSGAEILVVVSDESYVPAMIAALGA